MSRRDKIRFIIVVLIFAAMIAIAQSPIGSWKLP